MKIEELLEELKNSCNSRVSSFPQEGRMIRTMYGAIENTILPSEVNNEERLAVFIQLLMVCSQAKEKKELAIQFTNSIIAADYYFSVMKAQKAVPFLKKALECMEDVLEGTVLWSMEDADEFIHEFRAANLKEQQSRMNHAVNNICILIGAARKIKLGLSLQEVLMNHVPFSHHAKHTVFLLLLAMGAGAFIGFPLTESMAPWRKAIADGVPVSLLDAFAPMDMPYFCIGLFLLAVIIGNFLWWGSTSHIRLISKWAYWKFYR